MLFEGCSSRAHEAHVLNKTCPNCGANVEMFSTDVEAECENCGHKVFNDAFNCVMWCDHAKECVGEALYNKIMSMQDFAMDEKGEIKNDDADDDGTPMNYFSF